MNYNNENFEATCGKIYRKGMTVATIMTLVYTALKLVSMSIANLGNFDFKQFIIEFVMVAYVVAVGILGIIKFQGDTGEDTDHNVFKFYSRALNLYVALYAVVNLLVLPISSGYLSFSTVIAVIFVYLYYNLKINGIKINYSIIDYDNKKYYSRVFLRIAMIAVLFLGFGTVLGIVLGIIKNSLELFTKYLSTGFAASATLCLLYFIVSLVEKLDDDDSPMILKRGVKVLGIALLASYASNVLIYVFELITVGLAMYEIISIYVYGILAECFDVIQSVFNNIANASLFMLICKFALSLTDNKLLKFLKIWVVTYLVGNLVGGFTSSIRTILRFYKVNEMIPNYDTITMGLAFAYSLITTVIIVWAVIILVKKYGYPKSFYLLPLANVFNKILTLITIIFGEVPQGIILIYSVISLVLPVLNVIIVYKALKKQDEEVLQAQADELALEAESIVTEDAVIDDTTINETENTDE